MIEPKIHKANLHDLLSGVDDAELMEVARIEGLQITFNVWVTEDGVYWGGIVPPIYANTDQHEMEVRTWDHQNDPAKMPEAFRAALTWASEAAVQDLTNALG